MEKASVKFVENMAFTASVEGSSTTIPLDANAEHGGSGNGLRPKPLMLVALAGCTGMDIASLIKKMRVEISGFEIDTEAEKSDDMPVVYTEIRLIYRFTALADDVADKLKKIVDMSQERYCGVAAMMRHFAKLSYSIVLNGKTIHST